MNNGDKPAQPIFNESGLCTNDDHVGATNECYGLTRREHFAAMAMQGLLANPNIVNAGGTNDKSERVYNMAKNYADGLLKALENK